MFTVHAAPRALPGTTAAALLAAVQTSHADGFSGTIVSHLSLGLPELPAVGDAGDGSSLTSLLSGSHTLQVWYGGVAKQRIALFGSTDETDLFRNGRDVWQWSSADRTAVHTVLPAAIGTHRALPLLTPGPGASSLTPDVLAKRAIAALDPSTRVQVRAHGAVADRSTYDMVLTPRTADTRLGSVHIAVDGATKVPLSVQVFARRATAPAIDVAFTSIHFGVPADRNFWFSPPPDATVHTVRPHPRQLPGSSVAHAAQPRVDVIGSGWSSVLALRLPAAMRTAAQHNSLLRSLTPVSGTWGKGRLLESDLLSVLFTDDGRAYAGAVNPAALYAAAGAK